MLNNTVTHAHNRADFHNYSVPQQPVYPNAPTQWGGPYAPVAPIYAPTSPQAALNPAGLRTAGAATPSAATFRGSVKIDYTKHETSNYPITLQGRLSADEFADIHARIYWNNMEAQIGVTKISLWAGMLTLGIGGLICELIGDEAAPAANRRIVAQLNREYAHRGIGFRCAEVLYERVVYMDVTAI